MVLDVVLMHVLIEQENILKQMVHAYHVEPTKLLILLEHNVLNQHVEITKLSLQKDYVKLAQHTSEEFNQIINRDNSKEDLNV